MDFESGQEATTEFEGRKPQSRRRSGLGIEPPLPASGLVRKYLDFTKDVPSPAVFRLWTAIHAVGACAERRCWTELGINRLYPNLFIFLVGPPGTGKSQALNPMTVLLRKSQSVAIAPNDMTKQGLLDVLSESAKGVILDGRPFDYHFLAICISELSNFMSKYDGALAGILTDLFDCPPVNDEKKRGHDKGKMIQAPGVSFIMGTATRNLGTTIAEDMWGSGFMARVIMVFSEEEIVPDDMFAEVKTNEALGEEIALGLRAVGALKGRFEWEPAAADLIKLFRINQKDGAPVHNRLAFYVTRRWLHLMKLCMVAALSDLTQTVTEEHFLTAYEWMLSAEAGMIEVFKDMTTHEDGAIFEELRSQMFGLYQSGGRKPIHVSVMYKFLSGRASANSVQRMVEIAEKAEYFRRVAGTSGDDALYIPNNPATSKPTGAI